MVWVCTNANIIFEWRYFCLLFSVIVRFGEHNLRQQPECVPILEELRCFRYRDVNVAAGFFPKGFNPDDSNRHNDIGLLRLEDHVDFAGEISILKLKLWSVI